MCCRSCSASFWKRAWAWSGFWWLEVSSLLFVYMLFNFFLSGHMFPLDMLPLPWRKLVELTPLMYLAYFPAAVLLGKIHGAALAWGLLVEAAWVVLFILLSRILFHYGTRRYSAFGGQRMRGSESVRPPCASSSA